MRVTFRAQWLETIYSHLDARYKLDSIKMDLEQCKSVYHVGLTKVSLMHIAGTTFIRDRSRGLVKGVSTLMEGRPLYPRHLKHIELKHGA